jgi:hypothetical protein
MTDTTTQLTEVLTTLCGGQAGPFVLRDQDDEPLYLSSLERLDALLAAEPEPYVDPLSDGLVRFVYQVEEAGFVGEWTSLTPAPSVVLTKGQSEARFYVLDQPQPFEVVEPLAALMGCDLTVAAPLPGSNGWAPAHDDAKPWLSAATFSLEDLAFLFDDTPAVVAPVAAALGKHRDATIRTVFDFQDPHLDEPVVITGGANRKSVDWKPSEMTRGQVINIFCRHNVAPDKDGPAVVLGSMKPGRRLNEAVEEMWFAGLDFDSGIAGDTLAQAIADTGLMAVMASTHSHLKTTTVESMSSIQNWLTENGREGEEITQAVVRQRMAEKGLEPSIVSSMEFEIVGSGEDQDVVITHAPIPKWRVIFPLAAPFVVADHATDEEDGHEVWRRVPRALAKHLGGLPFDAACVDVNRLWYLPAHPVGAEFRVDLFGGDLLDVSAVLAEAVDLAGDDVDQPQKVAGRKRSGETNRAAQGPFDRRWAVRRADGLDIVRLLEDRLKGTSNAKKLRGWSDGRKKRIIECPFNAGHSNPRDRTDAGCFASNAGDGKGDGFTIYCSHGSCKSKGRDRLDYLNKMVEDGWFSAGDVEAYDVVLREEPVAEEEVDVETALAEFAGAGSTTVTLKQKSSAHPASGYPQPKAAGKFELSDVDGRKFFAFPPDDEGKGGGLAYSRWCLVGGAVHPDRAGLRDLEIAFENEEGERETFRIPADKAANKAFAIGAMRGQGIAFGSAAGESAAHRILMMTQPTNQVIRDRTGWLEDGVFMMPTGAVVGAPEGADVRLSDTVRIKAPATAGTLEGWKAGAAEACRSNSLSLKVALLAGLAGPGIALTGQGTLVINFAGRSSQGKTFRQQVGVSASGPVKPGLGQLQSANSTQNAMEIPLERGSGSITAYDELHLTSARVAQNLIFIASGQQGRNRATNTGGQGTVRSWRGGVVTLSSEVGLAQRLQQEGERLAGGATVRAIEVNAAEGRLDNEAYAKVATMLTNYGHALPVVVTSLHDLGYVDAPELLAKRVSKAVADLGVEPTDAMAYRSATGLAYLIVAGDVAVDAGLLPNTFEPIQVAREVWVASMAGAMGAEDPVDNAIATLVENLNARKGEVYDPTEGREPFREIAAVVGQQDGEDVYVLRHSLLAEWSVGAADVRDLKRALLDRNIAIPYIRATRAAAAWASRST